MVTVPGDRAGAPADQHLAAGRRQGPGDAVGVAERDGGDHRVPVEPVAQPVRQPLPGGHAP